MAADGDALLDPDRVRSIGFSSAFRGYDQNEVRRYLEQVAEALRARAARPAGRPSPTSGPDGTPGVGRARPSGEATDQRRMAEGPVAAERAAELERTVVELEATVAELRRELAAREAEAVAARLEADAAVQRQRMLEERDETRRRDRPEHDALLADPRELAQQLRDVRAGLDRVITGLSGDVDPGRDPRPAAQGAASAISPPDPPQEGPPEVGDDAPVPLLPIETGELDELFARVRAGRDRAVSEARQVLAGGAADEGVDRPVIAPSASASASASASTAASTDADRAVGVGIEGPVTPATSRSRIAGPARDRDVGWDGLLPDLQRDALRRIKRSMVDAQSELLEAIAGTVGPVTAGELPDTAEHRGHYARAVQPAIGAALAAGAGGGASIDDERAAELASGLADRIAAGLQAGIEEAIAVSDGEPEALVDAIRVHHRRFRTGELARLVAAALGDAHAWGREAER